MRAALMLLRPSGGKSLMAENIALRQQLMVVHRRHKRAPQLTIWERLCFAFTAGLILPKRIVKTAIIVKPSTILKLHKALITKKYRYLFSNKSPKKPGPKGPTQELINLILEIKKKNPKFGYLRIAMQITNMFGVTINKDIVRRVLGKHYKPTSTDDGPSWLTFIGHAKDSLWSIDFFRTESIHVKSHWVMVVMDQFIGTIRRELLDQTLFWTANDLQSKLHMFQKYYNDTRCHTGIKGSTPHEQSGKNSNKIINMNDFRWEKQCRGLFNLPIAA